MAKMNAGDFLRHFAERGARDVGAVVTDLKRRKREELDRAYELEQDAKKAERDERIALLREAASARAEARAIAKEEREARKDREEQEKPISYGGNRYGTAAEKNKAIEEEAAAARRGAPPVSSTRARQTPLSENPGSRTNQRRAAESAAIRWSGEGDKKPANGWKGVARALRAKYPAIADEADAIAKNVWDKAHPPRSRSTTTRARQ